MLEQADALLTWELQQLPKCWATVLGLEEFNLDTVSALPLPDHRTLYLDYEGPLTENRGHVTRCDCGDYYLIKQNESSLEFTLAGKKLAGQVRLVRHGDQWQLEAC